MAALVVRDSCARRKIGAQGYVYVRRPGHPNADPKGWALEHRVVMEGVLGRPLERHENVHHINGDRTDNRAENLELWITSQPAGQRVDQLVEWARHLLRTYGGSCDNCLPAPPR